MKMKIPPAPERRNEINPVKRAIRQMGTRYLMHPANKAKRMSPMPTTAQLTHRWQQIAR